MQYVITMRAGFPILLPQLPQLNYYIACALGPRDRGQIMACGSSLICSPWPSGAWTSDCSHPRCSSALVPCKTAGYKRHSAVKSGLSTQVPCHQPSMPQQLCRRPVLIKFPLRVSLWPARSCLGLSFLLPLRPLSDLSPFDRFALATSTPFLFFSRKRKFLAPTAHNGRGKAPPFCLPVRRRFVPPAIGALVPPLTVVDS